MRHLAHTHIGERAPPVRILRCSHGATISGRHQTHAKVAINVCAAGGCIETRAMVRRVCDMFCRHIVKIPQTAQRTTPPPSHRTQAERVCFGANTRGRFPTYAVRHTRGTQFGNGLSIEWFFFGKQSIHTQCIKQWPF